MLSNRIVMGLLAAVLALTVAGCGKNAVETTPGAAGSSGSSTSGSSTSGSSTTGAGGSGGSNATGGGGATSPGGAGGQDAAQGGGIAPAPAEKVQLGPLAVGDTAEVGPITVTVHQVEAVDQAPAPGYTYLMVELTVQNGAEALYTVNPTEQHKLHTPEDKTAPYNLQATATRSPKLQGSLRQGESASGWLGFLAKRMDGTYKYTFIHPDYGEATWEFTIQ